MPAEWVGYIIGIAGVLMTIGMYKQQFSDLKLENKELKGQQEELDQRLNKIEKSITRAEFNIHQLNADAHAKLASKEEWYNNH